MVYFVLPKYQFNSYGSVTALSGKVCERGVCMWSEKLFYPGYLELAEIVYPFLLGAKRKIVIAAFNDDH